MFEFISLKHENYLRKSQQQNDLKSFSYMRSHSRMHRIAVTNAGISHHSDDDFDIHYHCNAFVSLLVCLDCLVLKNTYFKEPPWVIASKYSISNTEDNRNLNYVYCLNLALMEKVLRCQWNISSWLIAPRVKTWFYKRFFSEVVMVMVKDKRKYNKKISISIKISFMHCIK